MNGRCCPLFCLTENAAFGILTCGRCYQKGWKRYMENVRSKGKEIVRSYKLIEFLRIEANVINLAFQKASMEG